MSVTYAEIIVDIAHSEVDRVFDYLLDGPCAALGVGHRVHVPFGRTHTEGYIVALKEHTEVPAQRIKRVQAALDDYPLLLPEMVRMAYWMRAHYHCRLIDALRVMLPAQMRAGTVKDKNIRYVSLAVSPQEAGRLATKLARAPKQLQALEHLLKAGQDMDARTLCQQAGVDMRVLTELEKKSAITITDRRVWRRPVAVRDVAAQAAFVPSVEQDAVLARLLQAMQGQGGAFLLHGATGSGKTEVYMQCAAHALGQGRGVIILVPEIALTPQMAQRFTARFGDNAAVLHSRLSAGERYDEWSRIRRGEARLVIGARSAVFAPVQDPALIVVDEEHETSYRSESAPRYDALEVARWRAARCNAVYLAGSATPSVASYYAAKQGELELLRMPRRIGKAGFPTVQVVDMRAEFTAGGRGVLSAALIDALSTAFARGEQALLLLNRRGYSTFVFCRACGYTAQCQNCDIAMTWHTTGSQLKCHYCGSHSVLPSICPGCGSAHIRHFGDGTQKLEEQLREHFPGVAALRMDADTTRAKDAHLHILEQFRRHKAQVLIGTQMIAKGLDFPDVTVVGVVAADMHLHLQDYRAGERTYQLISQVAGRAGRADKPGRVVIQTYSPGHYAIQCAARRDYAAFYKQESAQRELCQYPPYTRLLRLLFTHPEQQSAQRDAQAAYDMIGDRLREPGLRALVPLCVLTGAPVARIKARWRMQVLVKLLPAAQTRALEAALGDWALKTQAHGSLCVLEIDPVGMI